MSQPLDRTVAAKRTVRRALLGFVVAIVSVSLLAYACSGGRQARRLTTPAAAAGLAQADGAGDPLLARVAALGPLHAVYGSGATRLVLAGGPRTAAGPQSFVAALSAVIGLPASTRATPVDGGPLGPLLCAPAPALGPGAAACVWSDADVAAAVLSPGRDVAALAPLALRVRQDAELSTTSGTG